MTDKQMIIDGVDVSGCIYYQYNMCTATKDNYGDCSLCCQDYEMKDCYYKQLKRKEQECEKLYIQLKADEEYHKEEENTLRKIIKNKEERNIELYKENNKYKQALYEIEKFAQDIVNTKEWINCTYNALKAKLILNIINKAKEEK